MGGVHGEGDPLTDQTEWVLDRIVELHPDANAGFAPQIAIQTIQEAIGALEGEGKFGATLFGLDPQSLQARRGIGVMLQDATLPAPRALAS